MSGATSNRSDYLGTVLDPAVLNPALYKPREEDLKLLQKLTGIHDETKLRHHALEVQRAAFAIHPWPCIKSFDFIKSRIENYPFYDSILKVPKEIPGAIFLDLGCCFGNDARRLVTDGWPVENVITSDLKEEYYRIALEFYKASDPLIFVQGDIFNPDFLSPDMMPTSISPFTHSSPPNLGSLTTLTPLQHHVSVINLSYVFLLFSEAKQHQLACLVATLLSPVPGSMIIGIQMDCPDTEENKNGAERKSALLNQTTFAHSPTSWRKLWMGIFGEGIVSVQSWIVEKSTEHLREIYGIHVEHSMYEHTWKVTRL